MNKEEARRRGLLTRAEMIRSAGLSPSAFDRLNLEPAARVGRNTFYAVADVLEDRLAHQLAAIERQRTPDRAEREERLRLTRAQREHQEIVNEQARARLAPTDLCAWTIEQAGRGIARTLGRIPSHVKRRLPKLTAGDLAVLRSELRKAQRAALEMRLDLDEYSNG